MTNEHSNQPFVDAEEILDGIRAWVEIETPSDQGGQVNKLVDMVEAQMQVLGTTTERTPGQDGYGDILISRSQWGHTQDTPGVLVLSHLDTVHPMGTASTTLPWQREGDHVRGPGI